MDQSFLSPRARRHASTFFFLIPLLSGCVTTGDIQPAERVHDLDQLALLANPGKLPVQPAAWPQQDWWREIEDHQLHQLIQEALASHPDMAMATARLRAAQAQEQTESAALWPALSGQASISGNRSSAIANAGDPDAGHFGWSHSLGLSLQWPLDAWGEQSAAWKSSLSKMRVAQIETQAARLLLSINVARAYLNLRYAHESLDLAEADVMRANTLLELTRQRFDSGIIERAPWEQARSEAGKALAERDRSRQVVAAGALQLALLLGQEPARANSLARPAPWPTTTLALPSLLPADLLGRRPDLVAARWSVEAARQGIEGTKARFLPNINLSLLASLATRGASNLFQAASRQYAVSPAMSLPLFDAGTLRADLRYQTSQYDLAVAHYNKLLLSALSEIAESIQVIDLLDRQSQAQTQALDAATQRWTLAAVRHRQGIGNQLDVLSLQQPLLQARQRLAQLQREQDDRRLLLIAALGGGFHATPTDRALLVAPSSQP